MTPDQLKAIRERCDRATPGPWTRWISHSEVFFGVTANRPSSIAAKGKIAECPDPDGSWGDDDEQRNSENDAEFIAAARSDVPALLAEVEELLERVHHWREKAECYGDIVHGCTPALETAGFHVDRNMKGGIRHAIDAMAADRDRLLDEVERLRKLLAELEAK